jgi:hypothetical protein
MIRWRPNKPLGKAYIPTAINPTITTSNGGFKPRDASQVRSEECLRAHINQREQFIKFSSKVVFNLTSANCIRTKVLVSKRPRNQRNRRAYCHWSFMVASSFATLGAIYSRASGAVLQQPSNRPNQQRCTRRSIGRTHGGLTSTFPSCSHHNRPVARGDVDRIRDC